MRGLSDVAFCANNAKGAKSNTANKTNREKRDVRITCGVMKLKIQLNLLLTFNRRQDCGAYDIGQYSISVLVLMFFQNDVHVVDRPLWHRTIHFV